MGSKPFPTEGFYRCSRDTESRAFGLGLGLDCMQGLFSGWMSVLTFGWWGIGISLEGYCTDEEIDLYHYCSFVCKVRRQSFAGAARIIPALRTLQISLRHFPWASLCPHVHTAVSAITVLRSCMPHPLSTEQILPHVMPAAATYPAQAVDTPAIKPSMSHTNISGLDLRSLPGLTIPWKSSWPNCKGSTLAGH